MGHWEADGGDVNIPVGFIPDYVKVMDLQTSTNIEFYEWWQRQEQDMLTGLQEGVSIKEGITARLADDAGIKAFDTGSVSPAAGTGAGQLSEWAASTTYTAKTNTARGSFLRGTVGALTDTGQVVDREAIFEVITGAGTSASSEPTWPTAPGDTVLDNDQVYQLVTDVPTQRQGYQGFVVADNIQTNGNIYFYLALKADDSLDHGDVDGWPGGTDPDWS